MYERTATYYDAHADIVFDVLGRYYNAHLISRADSVEACVADDVRYIVEHAGVLDGHAVLECGAGSGCFARLLMQARPSIRYVGVDLSRSQIAVARRVNPSVDIREMNFGELDFPEGSFDRVLFLETIGYCIDLTRLVRALLRVVRPGGRVLVKNPGQRITDRDDHARHAAFMVPVSREYGFADGSLGLVPDIDRIVETFRSGGFLLREETRPYFDEFFFNSAFYADPRVCRRIETPHVTSIAYDFSRVDPATMLSALGRTHPAYVRFHRALADRTAYWPRNEVHGAFVLVFERALDDDQRPRDGVRGGV